MEKLYFQLLEYFNITEEEYDYLTRPLSFKDVYSPYKFDGMSNAIALVKKHINSSNKIMIYGDYDCDGIMSTSIVYKALESLGVIPGYYIPSRYIDGYGLTIERAKQIVEKGYKLLITVDNGITAFDAIEFCKNNGVDVIVIDHHQQGEKLPVADAIIHPFVSNFSSLATSAGFCSFMFSYALLDKIDNYLLILGAISVISDMMPLKDFNRDIVRLATQIYESGKYCALDLLKEGDEFNYMSIGMRMSPKINAVGRILKTNKINMLVPFLVSNDKEKVFAIYKEIDQINENRKYISKNIDFDLNMDEVNKAGIVTTLDVEEGMIGILANKLMNEYKKPVIVFTHDSKDPELLKGSCRSLEGFNIVKCFEELESLLLNAGGHAYAGGLSIRKKDYINFKELFIKQCEMHPVVEVKEKTININLTDVNLSTYRLIDTLSPFGEEWKQPLLEIKGIKTSSLVFNKTGEHLLTTLGQNSKLVGFNISKSDILSSDYIDILGNINFYIYRGYGNVQFLLKKYKPSTN